MPAKRTQRLVALLCIGCFVAGGRVYSSESPLAGLLRPRIVYSAGHTRYAGLGDGIPAVDVDSQGFLVSYLGLNLGYRISTYNWKSAPAGVFSPDGEDLWDELHTISASARSMHRFREDWMLIYGVRAGAGFERQLSRSFSGGASLALRKQFSERWSGTIGAGASYHPLRSSVLPLLGMSYDDEDVSGFSAVIGYPTQIGYRVSESLRLLAALGQDSGTYRLKDTGPVAKKGYFAYRSFASRLGFEYRPFPNFELTAAGLYHFERHWRLYDSSGSRIARSRPDSAPGFAFSASWRF